MRLGRHNGMAGLGCPGGCRGTAGLYEWVQGVDGLGHVVGRWQPVGDSSHEAYTTGQPSLGEIAEGADGRLYEWVQGVDGLGNAFGFWKRLTRGVSRLRRAVKSALPIAQRFAPLIPGGAALTAATPLLRRVGLAGADGLGELYEAADGSLYQVQGIDADDELSGLGADEELDGLEADDVDGIGSDELEGIAADESLDGMFAAADDLDGVDADDELNGLSMSGIDGLADDDVLDGLAQIESDDDLMSGYLPDTRVAGVDGYRPDAPPSTRPFAPVPHAPMWTPLW